VVVGLRAPYHAWTYGLDGRLVAIPQREAFKGLDFARHGLATVEQEIFLGFVFIRFAPGLPSVKEMASPYADELAAYRMEELIPQGRVTFRQRSVNWKNVADNYSDGLHINVAHPGLTRLFGRG
jgi:phenylpropionate dioxygenase-like ring-hydroxylating dioxygenase large terminal subunit